MRGYAGLHIPTSASVRFVRDSDVDGSEAEDFAQARARGIRIVYVDASACSGPTALVNLLGDALQLDHPPYDYLRWTRFADDLISVSYRVPGLVIVVDGAWNLLETCSAEMFDLIEAFLIQFHHWSERSKPCYLCLQMERNPGLAQAVRA